MTHDMLSKEIGDNASLEIFEDVIGGGFVPCKVIGGAILVPCANWWVPVEFVERGVGEKGRLDKLDDNERAILARVRAAGFGLSFS